MRDKTKIKPIRWVYLAGLVDGDGSITIRRDVNAGFQLTLYVYSTHRGMMNWLVQVFGGSFEKQYTIGNRKQKYRWYTSNPNVVTSLAPHLKIKKAQGSLAVSFFNMGNERDPELRQEIKNELERENNTFALVSVEEFKEAKAQPLLPTKEDYAYIAGLIDAEGSFSIFKRAKSGNGLYTSTARISNTDGSIFPWLGHRFGGNTSLTERDGRDEGCWSMTGQEQRINTMLAIIPYLVIKKQRAIIFLQWIRTNRQMSKDEKSAAFLLMRKLNQRGLSPEANTLRLQNLEDKTESDLPSDMQSASTVMLAA